MIGIKQLWIKDDGINPTASLKDRASAMAVAKAYEAKADTIACSSTGNAASSLAGMLLRQDLRHIFSFLQELPKEK